MKRIKDGSPARALPVTTARTRLFDLVEEVLDGRTPRVELSHRDRKEHVVLLRKSELDGLEADLRALRAHMVPAAPRPLRGMARLNVEPEEVLTRTRARQTELAASKRASLGGNDTPEST